MTPDLVIPPQFSRAALQARFEKHRRLKARERRERYEPLSAR